MLAINRLAPATTPASARSNLAMELSPTPKADISGFGPHRSPEPGQRRAQEIRPTLPKRRFHLVNGCAWWGQVGLPCKSQGWDLWPPASDGEGSGHTRLRRRV